MGTNEYTVIGVMSGTSLDGIDLACVKFKFNNGAWSYQFIATATQAYTKQWREKLSGAMHLNDSQLKLLDQAYTAYLAEQINAFIKCYQLKGMTAICSHGHTVFHQPDQQKTLQIGNLPKLATLTQQNVICDFRRQDVTLGGQGAPLVPVGDQFLFSGYDACLNLGGFANISLQLNHQRIAFDICPVNTVLNHYAQKCGKAYDEGGKLARASQIDQEVLKMLNQLPFYKKDAPKSLGMEWVHRFVFPILKAADLSPKEILATFTEHIAQQLSQAIPADSAKVLVTGGGAYNEFLIDRLQELTKSTIVLPETHLIDYKEALVFGLLGVLRLRDEPNVFHSVTGAEKDHCAGFIYSPART